MRAREAASQPPTLAARRAAPPATSAVRLLLDTLNPPQREAVMTTDGPLLVIAGAGSGKTRVITYRIAWLIREAHVAPRHIFAATFTNKAAGEMRDRVLALLGHAGPTPLAINTFHALCAMILRRHAPAVGLSQRFLIADERDAQTAMREALKDLAIRKEDLQPSQALWVVSQCKLRLLGPDGIGSVIHTPAEELYRRAFVRYQEKLRADDAVDFDDLIGYVVQLFEEHPDVLEEYRDRYRYLLVDEYQDTNHSQFRLVELLAGGHRNVCVVGDEDQSIYSWRGADISNLLDFQKQYPEARLIRLEQNYRSTGNILTAAAAVIAHNTERIGKTLWTELGDGLPIGLLTASSEVEEGERICRMIEKFVRRTGRSYRDIALFYRVNSVSRVYEEALRAHEIPYQVIGGTGFYDRMEVRDLVSYLQVVANPNANLALLRIINKPRRGVGEKTLNALMNEALRGGRSLFEEVRRAVDEEEVKGRARTELAALCRQVEEWMRLAAKAGPADVLRQVLEDTNYRESLGDPASIDVKTRLDHVEELIDGLVRFEQKSPDVGLTGWLETIALASAQDEITDEDRVSLMTIHAAKGLEFPLVFITGMEDPIFPNRRAVEERGDLEEERRLFYVGVTRARRLLVLSRAEMRVLHGELRFNAPSPLLFEVPEEVLAPAESIDLATLDAATRDGSRGARAALEAAGFGGDRVRERQAPDAGRGRGAAGPPTPRGGGGGWEGKIAAKMREYQAPGGAVPRGGGGTGAAGCAPQDRHWVPLEEEEGHLPQSPGPAAGRGGAADGDEDLFGGGRPRAGQPSPRRLALPGRARTTRAAANRQPAPAAPGEDAAEPLAWARVGVRVRHEHYGEGIVIGQSGRGRDRRLLVAFDEDPGRQLEILARFARLEPVA